MQAGNRPTTLETSGPSRLGPLVLAGQVVLTLAMLTGIGVWLIAVHGGRGRAARMQPRPAVAAQAAAAAQPDAVVTYYLVSSEDKAVALRDGLSHLVPAPDLKAVLYDVVVAGSPDEEVQALQTIDQENVWRVGNGQPLAQVLDLRTPSANVLPADGIGGCEGILPLRC